MRGKALLSIVALTQDMTLGFQPIFALTSKNGINNGMNDLSLLAVQQQQQEEETAVSISKEAARLRQEAEMMRLQAEQMDLSLTLQKIEALESKLQNKAWLEKNPDQVLDLQYQLQLLTDKLTTGPDNTPQLAPKSSNGKSGGVTTAINPASMPSADFEVVESETPSSKETLRDDRVQVRNLDASTASKKKALPKVPLAGFDDTDLDLYIPVAKDINKLMPDANITEKLEAFRTAPELQAHFQKKIQNMLVGPLEEMQRLEKLRQDYLDSSSSKEREQLKSEIDKLENSIEEDGPFMYSDGFYCEMLLPLTESELGQRMEAVESLPDILIAIYKQRNGLNEDEDLSLAIQMDYYEPQLQLLEQVRMMDPLTDDMKSEYIRGFESLPKPVQRRFAKNSGIDEDSNPAEVLEASLKNVSALSPLMQVVEASNMESNEPKEYNDIEFVDRSRFLEEFFPAIGNMEGKHPSEEEISQFASDVLNKKSFMVTSKPERVAGGYYIRGTNLLEDDADGTKTAADKLIATVSKQLENSHLSEKLDFFYILDPAPPTDEEMEFGPTEKPIFVVTTKDPATFYKLSKPLTKAGITSLGLLSTFMFSIGACALNPAISDRFYASLDTASTTGILDLQWLAELCFPTFVALLGTQLAHEIAHRLVATKDKFDIGLPNVVPSITTGFAGAITPLKSPPPNSKSLFDFAISGPLAGLTVSILLLFSGLEMTSSMELGTQLPVIPVDLIRASSLGGGLVQFFLGNAAILPDQGPAAVLQLHPYAVAGFVGLLNNALALLPLGLTDGGRIAVAMFGRRGAFVVKLFTTLLLCSLGLFGLDDTNLFLVYVLFATIWQRELESPARNEVDELDFPRGLVGISAALVVGLVLIPMF